MNSFGEFMLPVPARCDHSLIPSMIILHDATAHNHTDIWTYFVMLRMILLQALQLVFWVSEFFNWHFFGAYCRSVVAQRGLVPPEHRGSRDFLFGFLEELGMDRLTEKPPDIDAIKAYMHKKKFKSESEITAHSILKCIVSVMKTYFYVLFLFTVRE